jgi:nucleotide-binding universal stress UspA family protein
MYKHILVPTDGSPLSLKAAKTATALAKALRSDLTVLYVTPRWMPPVGSEGSMPSRIGEMEAEYRSARKVEAVKALDRVCAIATAAKIGCEQLHVTSEEPWDAIIRTATKRKCDLVVMASHGRGGLAGLLLGSETTKVLSHSKIPVLVCR